MSVENDRQLLRAWTEDRNEAAFRRLVERYAGLVHGAALRRTGDPDLAAETAQDVFVRLANEAGTIKRAEALPGWLHTASVRAAANRVRCEQRHHARMKRYSLTESPSLPGEPAWRDALPLLDEAISRLSETDRGLVLARYAHGESVAAAAQRFGLSHAAAQKRSERALEKLASLLRRRGVVLTAAALASGITPRMAHAAPAGAAAQWSAAAVLAPPVAAGTGLWPLLMNSKAASIAAAVMAFCTPVALKLRAGSHAPAANPAPPSVTAAPKLPVPAGSVSADTPDPRYVVDGVDLSALAREIRNFPPRTGRLRRELELRAAVQSLNTAQCATVAEWLADAPATKELHWVNEDLWRHWTMLDRAGALAAVDAQAANIRAGRESWKGMDKAGMEAAAKAAQPKRNAERDARGAVMRQWAQMDPQGMLAHYAPGLPPKHDAKDESRPSPPAKFLTVSFEGSGPAAACRTALRALATRDPHAAIAAAQNLEAGHGGDMMSAALTGWCAAESPEAAIAWVHSVTDAERKKKWQRGLMEHLLSDQPARAWSLLASWPGAQLLPDAELPVDASTAINSLSNWADSDPDAAAAAWLAGPPQWQTRGFAEMMARKLVYSHSASAEKLAAEIRDPAVRETYQQWVNHGKAVLERP